MNRPSRTSLSAAGQPQVRDTEDLSRSLSTGAPAIERAAASDLEALASLERRCFDAGVAISRRQFCYLLSRPTAEIWVCREHGRVVADAVILRRRTPRGVLGRFYSLVVVPDQRGRGIGRLLLLACLDRLRRQGAYAIVLEVRTDNRPAIALYRAEGFQVVRRLNGYYAGGQSAIRMCLPSSRLSATLQYADTWTTSDVLNRKSRSSKTSLPPAMAISPPFPTNTS